MNKLDPALNQQHSDLYYTDNIQLKYITSLGEVYYEKYGLTECHQLLLSKVSAPARDKRPESAIIIAVVSRFAFLFTFTSLTGPRPFAWPISCLARSPRFFSRALA